MLLSESYKLQSSERLEDINIELIPHMKKQDASEIISHYKMQLIDLDNFKDNEDYSALNKLKKEL